MSVRGMKTWIGLMLASLASCSGSSTDEMGGVLREDWGSVDGERVELFTLRNKQGTTIKITNYGAIITELHLVDRDGAFEDVVLGFDSLEGYRKESPYFGCIAGRYANRIAGGKFEIDGKSYEVARNNGPNHLHGGEKGFDKHIWTAHLEESVGKSTANSDGETSVRLTRVSAEGEEGYPGRVEVSVVYTLTDKNVLRVDMSATTDAPTLVNLAQHSYWNLSGHGSGTIASHVVRFYADKYVPVDGALIPTGKFESVDGTPFDFRQAKAIGDDLRQVDASGGLRGFDHDFVIDGKPDVLRPVCEVIDPKSGRRLELWSDQPGCQFYTGNFLDGSIRGKGGVQYRQYQGLCLETQFHPDSIHNPTWPSPVLRPDQRYEHHMEYRFGTIPH